MKTIRRAFDMLKKSRKESWAYLLTLTLSASLLLLFINIQNDTNFLVQVTDVSDPMLKFSSLVALGGITLVIAVVCAINCYVANMYFLKAKSQELCVYLSSGMNIVGLAKHLLLQNFMILVASLGIGAVLGILMNPIVNLIIYNVLDISGAMFTITWKGIGIWILILFFEIFYLFLINIGYAYKAELKDLLDENNSNRIPDLRIFKTPAIIYPILLVLSFVGILVGPVDVSFYSICVMFAFIGVKGCFQFYIPKLREKKNVKYKDLHCEKMILSGNVNALLKTCYMYILMIFLLVVMMSCAMVDGLMLPYVKIIMAVAYILLLIMMSASLFFKIMLEASKRKKEFYQLELLGLPRAIRQPIVRKEIIRLFTYIIAVPLPFSVCICYHLIRTEQMALAMGVFLQASFVLILLLVGFISVVYYDKSIIEKRGVEE